MKLLAINGSHRGDKGHTRHLLDLLVQGASEAGAECEIVTLAKCKINRWLSCGECHGAEHYLQCAYHDRDDVASIFDKIAKSDVMIYATPVYVFGMSGLLKTFLDRLYSTSDVNQVMLTQSGLLFHHIDHAVCSKPFVSLVCCDNLEDETPRNALSYKGRLSFWRRRAGNSSNAASPPRHCRRISAGSLRRASVLAIM